MICFRISLRACVAALMFISVAMAFSEVSYENAGWKGIMVSRHGDAPIYVEIDTGLEVEIVDGTMVISSKGSRYEVDLDDMESLTHTRGFCDITTAEPDIKTFPELSAVAFTREGLKVSLPDGVAVPLSVYDISGRQLCRVTVSSGSVVPLCGLPGGTLIVRVGEYASLKILHSR